MLAVTGFRSRIAQELKNLLPPFERMVRFTGDDDIPAGATRFLFCAGMLPGTDRPSANQAGECIAVNFTRPRAAIEKILATIPAARIVVIGSESAITGSFDKTYAESKKAIHTYVEQRRVGP